MNPVHDPLHPAEPIVRVSCVRHTYPDKTSVHLCGLDFVVEPGQRVVLLGPNGCGKSTLLYHILGLLSPEEGDVSVFGVDPGRQFSKIRERVGVLLQNADEQIIAPTVWDDVSFSPRNYGYTEAEVEQKVNYAHRRMCIEHLRHKVCHYLSGGEKRKVALAGALVLEPELMVRDEPFEGLDPSSRSEMLELLNALNREHGVSFVVATHDVQQSYPDVFPKISDAPKLQGQYFELFPSIPRWQQRTQMLAHHQHFLQSPWGFRHWFWRVFYKSEGKLVEGETPRPASPSCPSTPPP